MGQSKQMKILIYRPDQKEGFENENVDADCLYYPNGRKYTEPKPKEVKHPLDRITKAKITNSFVEVYK